MKKPISKINLRHADHEQLLRVTITITKTTKAQERTDQEHAVSHSA